ncbi:uncharacterized protein CC84DRAFT_1255842 [Paraphaeosphaeria sporulosa]|uniref:Uncharacterized protein n=1 Tax=Paraphaeosphaeria sporulosa TaxID=1460663 RepID=A0A177CQX1_9PLEO|nr:uncharacterized protein CC84DRAFT_1255842 [Paraphaeosphaeria sporulosa]OAG09913.1 hypothetical protein CC84DRAFT_1255842 [Paraphaeosphaeria sporulosa]
MSYLSVSGSARLPSASRSAGITHIARTASDSDTSSDESLETQDAGEDGATDLALDFDEEHIDVGSEDVITIGSSSPRNIANDIPDEASEEDSSDTQRRAVLKKAKKAAKKMGKKNRLFVANEKSHHAWTMSTFKNKLGITGMEAFLSHPEFGIDVATEFPLKTKTDTPFYDNENNPISRAEALGTKCHEMHEILIDSHKAAMAEEASRKAEAKRVFEGHRHDLPDAVAPDSHQTMLARINLQAIRDHASTQINAAYNNKLESAAELTEPELGSDKLPLVSATVQRLVYKVVDAQIRGNRLRALHVSESGDRRFQIPVEHGQLRFRLRDELQKTLTLEDDVDVAAIATKLVVQEFPPQL